MTIKLGLHIKTVAGKEFDVWGPVTSKRFPDDGTIYYCDNHSFCANNVQKIYGTSLTAEELFILAEKQGAALESTVRA